MSIYQPTTTGHAHSGSRHGLDDFLATYAEPVRDALRAVIAGLPRPAQTPGELARRLSLDRKSVWRVWNAVQAASLEEAALQLSGEAALARFLDAMDGAGTPHEATQSAREAIARFETAVEDEVGDRITLRLMLTPKLTEPDADPALVRAQFDAARARQGVQAATAHRTAVRVPNQYGEMFDLVTVRSIDRLRTLRNEPEHVVFEQASREIPTGVQHVRQYAPLHEPLSGSASLEDDLPPGGRALALVSSMTQLRGRTVFQRDVAHGTMHTVARGGRTGRRGESSFAYGEAFRSAGPLFRNSSFWGIAERIMIPVDLLIIEMYVSDQEFKDGMIPEPRVYDRLSELPDGGRVDLGGHAGALEHYPPQRKRPSVDEIRHHEQLNATIEEHLDDKLTDLHLFRWRVRLPLVGMCYTLIAINTKDQAG